MFLCSSWLKSRLAYSTGFQRILFCLPQRVLLHILIQRSVCFWLSWIFFFLFFKIIYHVLILTLFFCAFVFDFNNNGLSVSGDDAKLGINVNRWLIHPMNNLSCLMFSEDPIEDFFGISSFCVFSVRSCSVSQPYY